MFAIGKIRTRSGRYLDAFATNPADILIEDIAHALSRIPRWAAHSHTFYSVAEHSLSCLQLAIDRGLSAELQLEALLHDASEAYLLDMPKPWKVKMPEYQSIEDGLMRVIAKRLGFSYPIDSLVKQIDQDQLVWEWENLVINEPPAQERAPEFRKVRDQFLERYYQLV